MEVFSETEKMQINRYLAKMPTSLCSCTSAKFTQRSELHAGRAAKEMRGVEKNVRRRDKHVRPGIFQIRWLLRRRPPRWSRVEDFWTFRALVLFVTKKVTL